MSGGLAAPARWAHRPPLLPGARSVPRGPGRWSGHGPSGHQGRPGSGGQATVELALVLPVVVLVLLLVVQLALVARAQILVVHAAREGARAAAVDGRPGAAARAARATPGLVPHRVQVTTSTRGAAGSRVRVTVRYRVATDVALVGRLVGDVDVRASVTMRVEGGP